LGDYKHELSNTKIVIILCPKDFFSLKKKKEKRKKKKKKFHCKSTLEFPNWSHQSLRAVLSIPSF
jgi:hypothetical protein